jgi:hypothetical protein
VQAVVEMEVLIIQPHLLEPLLQVVVAVVFLVVRVLEAQAAQES